MTNLQSNDLLAAYKRSGEYTDDFQIRGPVFLNFYVDSKKQMVARYVAQIADIGEEKFDRAMLFIRLTERGFEGCF